MLWLPRVSAMSLDMIAKPEYYAKQSECIMLCICIFLPCCLAFGFLRRPKRVFHSSRYRIGDTTLNNDTCESPYKSAPLQNIIGTIPACLLASLFSLLKIRLASDILESLSLCSQSFLALPLKMDTQQRCADGTAPVPKCV